MDLRDTPIFSMEVRGSSFPKPQSYLMLYQIGAFCFQGEGNLCFVEPLGVLGQENQGNGNCILTKLFEG